MRKLVDSVETVESEGLFKTKRSVVDPVALIKSDLEGSGYALVPFLPGDRTMASALATGELFMVRSKVRLGTSNLSDSSCPVIGDTIDW